MPALRDPAVLDPADLASPEPVTAPPTRQLRSPLPVPTRTPALPDPDRPPAPVARRLPQHQGKLARVSEQVAGLSEDLREWVELRIALVQAELNEQLEFRIAQGKQGAAAGALALLGAFFLLVTLALLVGWVLFLLFEVSVPLALFLGFLILTLLLFATAFVLFRVLKPKPLPSVRPSTTPDA